MERRKAIRREKITSFERKKNAGRRRVIDKEIGKAVAFHHLFKVHHSTTLMELLLAKLSKSMSRNNIKGLLSGHKVLVNDQMISQFNYPLAKDDEVKIAKQAVHSLSHERKKKAVDAKFSWKEMLLWENDDFLAVNKPQGLLSVASDNSRDCAYAYVVNYLSQKNATTRPFILHRIDKETSGVLVFAKNIKLHSMLRMHWNELVQLREYYAVVEGRLTEKKKTLVSYLRENENNLVMITGDRRAKKSITHYEVVTENKEYSLLRVCIDTGRKNQIRVQMRAIGHPIVGDDKYGSGNKSPLPGLGLHASCLQFSHPLTKNLISIKAPIPKEFLSIFGKKNI